LKTVVYTITQKIETELEGQLRWVTILDLSVSNLWLRKYANAAIGVEATYLGETIGTPLGLASFSFDIEEGNYQMWKAAYANLDQNNRVDLYHGGAFRYKYEVDESLPYMKKITDGSGTYWAAESLEVRSGNSVALTNENTLITKEMADGSYLTSAQLLDSFYTEAETNNLLLLRLDKQLGAPMQDIYSQVYFREPNVPYVMLDPSHLKHATNKGWVEAHVNTRLASISSTAFQQSGNIIRVIPSGTQENSRVYRTLEAGISQAASFASATRQMIVVIEGEGVDGATLLNFNRLPVGTANPYIDVIGKTSGTVVIVSEDTYTGTAGTDIMANLTFDNVNADAFTTWINRTFYNCRFTNLGGPANGFHAFTNCLFYNCSTNNANTYDTACKGDIVNSITGAPELRQLAKYNPLQNISSATNLTLTNGNYFRIFGLTEISRINSAGWTAGSQIMLYIWNGLTITGGVAASGSNLGIVFKGGGNKTYAGGQYVVLFLGDTLDYWRELISY